MNPGQAASSGDGNMEPPPVVKRELALRPSSSAPSQDSHENASGHGGARDLHRRGDIRRGHDPQPRRKLQVMISGEELERSDKAPLRGLCGDLRKRGWSLCALMVLFTLSTGPATCVRTFLGQPVECGRWSEATGQWSFGHDQNLVSSAVSSTMASSATTRSVTSISPPLDHLDDVPCYAFYKDNARVSWMADFFGKDENIPRAAHKDIQQALVQGGVDVSEVYSPPRLTERAKRHSLRPGTAMDLATGWNFAIPRHRREGLRLLREHQPALIMLCPPCGPFSSIRNLTNYKRDPDIVQAEMDEGRNHLRFAMSLATMQLKEGRGFIFEHPQGAASWRTPEVQPLLQHPQVLRVVLDMCAFGLHAPDGTLHRKPTVILTNVSEIARALSRRCTQDHPHMPLTGGQLTADAAKYTPNFVDAVLKGLRRH